MVKTLRGRAPLHVKSIYRVICFDSSERTDSAVESWCEKDVAPSRTRVFEIKSRNVDFPVRQTKEKKNEGVEKVG